MLSGSVERFTFWRLRVKVDIYRSRTYICHVARKPQLTLIDLNRRLLYGSRRFDPRTIIIVNQWKHGD